MRFPPWIVALVSGVLLPVVGIILAREQPAISVAVSLLGGGAALALLLLPDLSVLLWMGSAITMGVGILLFHVLARAVVPGLSLLPVSLGLAASSILLGVLSATVLARTRWPRTLRVFQRDDLVVLLALLPVLGSTFLVHSRNGYVAGGDSPPHFAEASHFARVASRDKSRGGPHFAEASHFARVASRDKSRGGEEFHARGFVNGDTFTLFALVNAARTGNLQFSLSNFQTPLNPFAAGAPLEYPVLLHQALADVLNTTGGDIARLAWWLLVPVLFGVVAVTVLSARYVFGDPRDSARDQPLDYARDQPLDYARGKPLDYARGKPLDYARGKQRLPLWSVLVLLGAFGSTWESFSYPQSHAFLTGLFLLFVLLLVLRDQSGVRGERIARRFAIGGLTILLLFSNAVLGTAALAIVVTSNLLQLANRHWPRRERVSGLVGAAILLVLFLLFPPGAGALGSLNVAYTAIPQFLTAAIPALLVLWAVWEYQFLHRSPTLLGASVVLPTLGLFTLFGSARDIVAENSPRFLFLLVLLGWPAVIPLSQRLADWWWRQVRHVEHPIAERLVLWGGGAFALMVVLLPVVASVSGTLDVLARKPPKVVSADELAAFVWMRENLPPDAVILRAPESLHTNTEVSPLSLPAFTGRSQFRSEYWLSPADERLAAARAFFSGVGAPPPGARYVFCGPELRTCPDGGSAVFVSGSIQIRELTHE